ncbi:MAG: 1,4-alpha-glucan branching enzyme, partial [Negativicutes bacterium]|nr:1,4-alpha-glucan branching enzyme [Negativicutes bacterium]
MDKTAFRATGEYCVHLTEGAQITSRDGEAGVMFAVWAPHARQVNLVGHFNNWQGYHHPMQRDRHGRWSLFVRGVNPGTVYCFEVYTSENHRMMKFDPVAFTNGVAPDFTSRVADLRGYSWQDGSWMAERAGQDKWQRPINIYDCLL